MKVVLIGWFCEVYELCKSARCAVCGYTDKDSCDLTPYGHVSYFGTDETFIDNPQNVYQGYKLVATPDKPEIRKKIYDRFSPGGYKFATVVGQTVFRSNAAELGDGCVIAEGVYLMAKVSLGRLVRVNTAAVITHECVVGDYATIAPRAVLLGRVKVGEGAYIGANATILPGLTIGKGAIVGAGAVVTKNVPDGETWVGVPAKKLKHGIY